MIDSILSLDSRFLIVTIGVAIILSLGAAIYLLLSESKKARRAQKQEQAEKRREFAQAQAKAQQLDSSRLREVYKLLTDLTATLNYQRVIDMALDLGMEALTSSGEPAEHLVGAVLLFSSNDSKQPDLYIGASRRLTPADMKQTFPATEGLLQEVIDEGGALLSTTISQDPELGRVIAMQRCKSAYCIPLRQGLDTYGVMLFGHPHPNFFTDSHREVLNILARQAVISIQNARLYQDLEEEKERMMEIQEEARKKLARDLHDGPTQAIAAIAMRVNFARRLMARDQAVAEKELFKIEDMARKTTKEIRHMLFTLRPLVLETKGLIAALQSMAEKMRDTYDQNVVLEIDPQIVSELEMDKQGVIFYIIEEAVTNARKHAEAAHIWVRLRTIQKDLALLEIEDDGAGFDMESVTASYEHRGSLGMINLRERTELISGILNMESAEGEGTHIQVAIPLSEEAIDRIHHSA